MIRKENERYVVELGNNNTFISNIIKKGEIKSRGIIFSNNKEKVLDGNSVIIEMINKKDSIGYIKSIFKFLETHEDDENRLNKLKEIENKLVSFVNES